MDAKTATTIEAVAPEIRTTIAPTASPRLVDQVNWR